MAMSYPSVLQPVPIKVFNPSSVAVFASVGVHAFILGMVLPSLSSFSATEKASAPRNVAVIELTPAEQSRLPALSNSAATLPDISNLSLPNSPTTDLSSFPTNPAPLPNILSFLPAPSSVPALPPLPPLSYSSNLPITLSPRAFLPPPPASTSASLPQNPSAPSLATTNSLNPPQPLNFEPQRAPINPDELINRKLYLPNSQGTAAANPNPTQPFTGRNSGMVSPSEPETSETSARDRQIRRLVALTLQRANDLREDKSNTTAEEATQNDVAWMRDIGKTVSKGQEHNINLAGVYPKEACFRQLTGTSVYGIVVDTQGKLMAAPYLLKSAGYPILNQQALQQISGMSFANATANPKPYRVYVDFQYDSKICPSVAIVQPRTTNSGTPQVPETPAVPVTPRQAPAPSSPASPTLKTVPNAPAAPIAPVAPTTTNPTPTTSSTVPGVSPSPPAAISPTAVNAPPVTDNQPLGAVAPKKQPEARPNAEPVLNQAPEASPDQ
jgi:hypothetical protein